MALITRNLGAKRARAFIVGDNDGAGMCVGWGGTWVAACGHMHVANLNYHDFGVESCMYADFI